MSTDKNDRTIDIITQFGGGGFVSTIVAVDEDNKRPEYLHNTKIYEEAENAHRAAVSDLREALKVYGKLQTHSAMTGVPIDALLERIVVRQ